MSAEEPHLSIGDVATATGISVDTIRAWERRYGRPVPVRLPKGHRRYTSAQVRWMRRVAEALSRGHRPGKVVRATDEELTTILEPGPDTGKDHGLAKMLKAVGRFDRSGLVDLLEDAWQTNRPAEALDMRLGPLITAVGRAWADGDLKVRHEHFMTEVLEDFLRSRRAGLPAGDDAPVLVLTTLPCERHGLGLQLAAIICALNGVRSPILGVDTPLTEIVRAAHEMNADAVAISVSLATGGVETDRKLTELRALLPAAVRLVIGGRGARGVRRGPRGVEYVDGLRGLDTWVRELKI
ncbi:MAG: MerR family transcriptional regulator [Planctomycetota bacterium]|nr:MerR family transcriptional regulator [Planctomycetota bacterium]